MAKIVIGLIVVAVLINYFIGTVFIVSGDSMYPTFKNGQLVWSNKVGYLFGQPKRGDDVIVRYPGDPDNKKYIKRVIGIPGETITIKNSKVYLGEEQTELKEDYLVYGVISEPNGQWKLKDNEYFLMGDNRPNSNDSRYFGPVERRFIFGHATFIIWPDFLSPK